MREREPVVSIASSQRPWAAELLRFLSDYGGARLQGTVLTSDDALEQEYEVLVIDDIASYLTPRLVERIRRGNRRIVGVYDPELGESGHDHLIGMGVDAALAADAGPDAFLELIASLSIRERIDLPEVNTVEVPVPVRRHITCVVGGDLAGDVALVLASAFAKMRQSTVLLDADTVSPMIAQRLSQPLVPNVLTALDALIQSRGTLQDSYLAGPDGVTLINGLPEPSEWESVRAADMTDLVEHLSARFDEVVLKSSPQIEDLSQFGGRVGRFEVARTMLGLPSDVAVLVDPSPVGLARALTWIARARELTRARIHVLFGHAPTSLYQRGELSEELTRSFVPSSITWLPDDPRRARAVWNGQPTPTGPFTRAIGELGRVLRSDIRVGVS